MVTALLWIALGLVAFSYVGYPIALLLWDAACEALIALRFLRGGPDRRGRGGGRDWPRVSLVFAAHDEETRIRRKIENCLELDYPADRLEIVVGCDGCTDRTAQIAREVGGARVRVQELTPRAGKASVLARVVPAVSGDVVALTDANVMLDPAALRALVHHFDDPQVGAVVGRLRLYDRDRRDYEEGLYSQYETFLEYLEGRRGCVLGANGGLYAIRRILFGPLEADVIIDDFVVPVRIAVRGWRVPFEPCAVAYEETTGDARKEFVRRTRIGAGNWQALARVPDVLDPRTGFVSFAFVSHKLLRWATPLLLAVALAANVILALSPGGWPYRLLLAAQLGFYALALAGRHGTGGKLRRLASVAHRFVAMNAALAVGFWRFLRGSRRAAWERTERGPSARPA